MPDEADRAQRDSEAYEEAMSKNILYDIPEGEAGECTKCEEESPRLINGVCARCRDKFKLP